MAKSLRIFVCEFITGGGLCAEPLPVSLACEGHLMLSTVLRDLLDLGQVELSVTRDTRLAPLMLPVTSIEISDNAWDVWRACIRDADAVLPIAPESGGTLERLTRLVIEEGKVLLGSRPTAIAVAASKTKTAQAFAATRIHTVPTAEVNGAIPESEHGWVVKPDDGTGCEDTLYFGDRDRLVAWRNEKSHAGHRLQPFVPGQPASLSMLCGRGRALLLACNAQWVEPRDERLHYRGVCVNGLKNELDRLTPLAQQIVDGLPELWGYVGADLVLSEHGPVLVEINPRLTTAYVGLRRSIGQNPARMILDLAQGITPEWVDISKTTAVEVQGGCPRIENLLR